MVFDLPAAPGSFDQRLPLLQRTVGAIAQDWVQMVEQRKLGSKRSRGNGCTQSSKAAARA
jgi:DNA ligase-1